MKVDSELYPLTAIQEGAAVLARQAEKAARERYAWRQAFLRLQSELSEAVGGASGRDPFQAIQICQRVAHDLRTAIEEGGR